MVSQIGVGAWAWGDRLFWGYDDSQEQGAQEAFNTAVDLGVNLFDTAEVVFFKSQARQFVLKEMIGRRQRLSDRRELLSGLRSRS